MTNIAFLAIVLLLSVVIIINNKKATSGKEDSTLYDTIRLWDGASFNGWTAVLADTTIPTDEVWMIRDSVLWARGDMGYLQTNEDYSDYLLHVEWRWPETPVNSGIF